MSTGKKAKKGELLWEAACRKYSSVPLDKLREQARALDLQETDDWYGKNARTKLCGIISTTFAEKYPDFLTKVNCYNIDDYDLIHEQKVADLPRPLQWIKNVNGKNFCFSLIDMYKIVKANQNRDPLGEIITPEQKSDIEKSYNFALKFLVTNTKAAEKREAMQLKKEINKNPLGHQCSIFLQNDQYSPFSVEELLNISTISFNFIYTQLQVDASQRNGGEETKFLKYFALKENDSLLAKDYSDEFLRALKDLNEKIKPDHFLVNHLLKEIKPKELEYKLNQNYARIAQKIHFSAVNEYNRNEILKNNIVKNVITRETIQMIEYFGLDPLDSNDRIFFPHLAQYLVRHYKEVAKFFTKHVNPKTGRCVVANLKSEKAQWKPCLNDIPLQVMRWNSLNLPRPPPLVLKN